MTDEQYRLLDKIREALEAQPEEPNQGDYEDGLMTKEEYYATYNRFEVVEAIKNIIKNEYQKNYYKLVNNIELIIIQEENYARAKRDLS